MSWIVDVLNTAVILVIVAVVVLVVVPPVYLILWGLDRWDDLVRWLRGDVFGVGPEGEV